MRERASSQWALLLGNIFATLEIIDNAALSPQMMTIPSSEPLDPVFGSRASWKDGERKPFHSAPENLKLLCRSRGNSEG